MDHRERSASADMERGADQRNSAAQRGHFKFRPISAALRDSTHRQRGHSTFTPVMAFSFNIRTRQIGTPRPTFINTFALDSLELFSSQPSPGIDNGSIFHYPLEESHEQGQVEIGPSCRPVSRPG